MNYRELGRTGWQVSEVSFGAWAIGGGWGATDDAESLPALRQALDLDVNQIDAADGYGDGRSSQLIGQVLRERKGDRIYVATKIGPRLSPALAEGYNRENLTAFIERSLSNLGVETLDLLQLHCPLTHVFYEPEGFGVPDDLAAAGKILHYGVSVEEVEEALKAIEYPNVQTVQIIFNMFRHCPADLFFPRAKKRGIGILARVPLVSGLLTGKMRGDTAFEQDDHRKSNFYGESFDVGETFSGVPYEVCLEAVEALRPRVPGGATVAQMALCWILMPDVVSCTISGAKHPQQAADNVAGGDLPPLSDETMDAVDDIYDRLIPPPSASAGRPSLS